METSEGDKLKNKAAIQQLSKRLLARSLIYAPFFGKIPNEALQVDVGKTVCRPVEARAQVIHEPSIRWPDEQQWRRDKEKRLTFRDTSL